MNGPRESFMKKTVALAILLLVSQLPLSAAGKRRTILTIGPTLSFASYGELLNVDELLAGALPGGELAVRCAERFEVWGSYKFSKTTYRMGHGYDRDFRLDAFAVGARFKPVRIEIVEPFIGAGLNYYHFTDDSYTPFIFPVNSAVGPYLQGGGCIDLVGPFRIQVLFKYNLVRRTVTRTTGSGSYHYRTDFSGLEIGVGLLFCISGRQQLGAT